MESWWHNKEIARLGEYASAELNSGKLQMLVDALKDEGTEVCEHNVGGTTDLTLDELTGRFIELGARLVERSTNTEDGGGTAIAVWPHGIVFLHKHSRHGSISFAIRDRELSDRCIAIGQEVLTKHNQGDVYTITGDSGALDLRRIGNAGTELVRENYEPRILEGYDRALRGLEADDPMGRLVIVDGPPGVGKTYMVRGLLDAVPNTTFVLLPASMLDDLTGPTLLPVLLSARDAWLDGVPRRLVLIIEDADAALVPRQSDNIALISAMLNLGDGILGHTLDLRLIVTTNAKSVDIDAAILRPGRLLERIAIGPLPAEHAAQVFQRLAGRAEDDPQERTLAQVYARAV